MITAYLAAASVTVSALMSAPSRTNQGMIADAAKRSTAMRAGQLIHPHDIVGGMMYQRDKFPAVIGFA